MDTDWRRPPRPRVDAAETEAVETLDHLVIAARLLADRLVLVVEHRHLDAVVRMMADAALDVIAVPIEHPGGNGQVLLEDLAQFELHAQFAVAKLVLGHEDDAAGVAVETVDDARPVIAVQMAEVAEVELQRV